MAKKLFADKHHSKTNSFFASIRIANIHEYTMREYKINKFQLLTKKKGKYKMSSLRAAILDKQHDFYVVYLLFTV